jgi:hypothetical protein
MLKYLSKTSWVVIAILLGSITIAVRNPQTIPTDGKNGFEYVLPYYTTLRDWSKTQIGEEYALGFPLLELCYYLLDFGFELVRRSLTLETHRATGS